MDPNYVAEALIGLLSGEKRQLGRSILLTGPWGCGKTFLWKDVATRVGRPTVYVSAFGAENAAQFKARLVTQALLSGASDQASRVPRLTDLTSKLARSAPGVVARMKSLAKGSVDALVGTLLHRVEVDPLEVAGLLPDSTVICIDDLERVAETFSVESLLGIVNSLSEQRRFDVVLICDEANIGAEDSARRESYKRYKEKTIHTQLTLRANVGELYERILAAVVENQAKRDKISELKPTIANTFGRSSTQNLRALARVFTAIDLYLGVANEIDGSRARLLCALAIEDSEGRQRSSEFYRFNDVAVRVAARMDRKNPSEQDQNRIEFMERYYGEEDYAFDESIFDLVRNGFVSADAIRRSRPEPAQHLSPLNAALKRASSGEWVGLSDGEVAQLISDLSSGLESDTDCDAKRLLEGLAWTRLLARTIEQPLPDSLARRVVARLVAQAEKGDESVNRSWEMYADALQPYIADEREAYRRESEAQARKRVREQLETGISTPDDSLARLIANADPTQLRYLLGEMTPDRLTRTRKTHPAVFRILAYIVLKKMGELKHLWPEVNENYEAIVSELDRVASDVSEERMDRWRARQLLPPGYQGRDAQTATHGVE